MSAIWMPAYVGIGSNLNDPRAQVRSGLDALARLEQSRLIGVSRLYRSPPLGPQNQPDFVNAVAGLLTMLSPLELLAALKRLEVALGRKAPVVRWGAREIDFDVLLYGTARVDTAELKVPHAGIPERNWVLYPLLDVAPELSVPGLGRVRELAERIGSAGLAIIE